MSHTNTSQEHCQGGGNNYPVFEDFHCTFTARYPVAAGNREEAERDVPLPSN
jgi:hypothetical protein